jgi:hypothetical protein
MLTAVVGRQLENDKFGVNMNIFRESTKVKWKRLGTSDERVLHLARQLQAGGKSYVLEYRWYRKLRNRYRRFERSRWPRVLSADNIFLSLPKCRMNAKYKSESVGRLYTLYSSNFLYRVT